MKLFTVYVENIGKVEANMERDECYDTVKHYINIKPENDIVILVTYDDGVSDESLFIDSSDTLEEKMLSLNDWDRREKLWSDI